MAGCLNHKTTSKMQKPHKLTFALVAAAALAVTGSLTSARAGDEKDVISDVMKTYHKAPKGTDPVCKKALDGKASAEELKKLVAAYKSLTDTKPPKGDLAGWKAKTTKLYEAAQSLEKGEAGASAKYKAAVDCKGCHSVYKAD